MGIQLMRLAFPAISPMQVEGDAVVQKATSDAHAHQHQQRKNECGQPAGDAFVRRLAVLDARRIKPHFDGNAACHERNDQPRHPSVGQFPLGEDADGVDVEHQQIAACQRQEKVSDDVAYEGRRLRQAVVLAFAFGQEAEEHQQGQQFATHY